MKVPEFTQKIIELTLAENSRQIEEDGHPMYEGGEPEVVLYNSLWSIDREYEPREIEYKNGKIRIIF